MIPLFAHETEAVTFVMGRGEITLFAIACAIVVGIVVALTSTRNKDNIKRLDEDKPDR